jgi:hypothetical protein
VAGGTLFLSSSHLSYTFQRDINDSDRCIDCPLADRCVFGVSLLRTGDNRDRGDICSISAVLTLRDTADNSAGGGVVGDCGARNLSSKLPSAEAPKNGWLSRPRVHDVGRDGGRGSRGLKSSGCVDLAKLPDDAIDGVYALAAVANGGLVP